MRLMMFSSLLSSQTHFAFFFRRRIAIRVWLACKLYQMIQIIISRYILPKRFYLEW